MELWGALFMVYQNSIGTTHSVNSTVNFDTWCSVLQKEYCDTISLEMKDSLKGNRHPILK